MDKTMPKVAVVAIGSVCQSWQAHAARFVMVGALIASAFGQDLKVWKSPDASLRSKVTELAFPHANVTEDGSEAVLVLRFAPSFSPEFQITATIQRDHGVSTEYRIARISSVEAFRRLSPSQRAPNAVARLMDVKQVSAAIPAEVVEEWLHQLWTALEASSKQLAQIALTRRIQLDGTQYSCEYDEGSMHLSIQLWGSEVGHERADDPALVKWMNQIRLKVQERVGSDLMPGR